MSCKGEFDHQAGTFTSSLAVQARRLASDRHRPVLERLKLSRRSSYIRHSAHDTERAPMAPWLIEQNRRGQLPLSGSTCGSSHHKVSDTSHGVAASLAKQLGLHGTIAADCVGLKCQGLRHAAGTGTSVTPFGFCRAELGGSARRGAWPCSVPSHLECW